MTTELPLAISRLAAALPHRPPMVWLDQVLSATKDGGTCAVTLAPSGLYFDERGELLTFAPVEWIAQAYGYVRATYEVMNGATGTGKTRALLVGVSELATGPARPKSGRVMVEVRLTRELAPLALVEGTVKTEEGELLGKARLKLYFEF